MTDPYVTSEPCAYADCSMPVEIVDVRGFASSDCSGHTLVVSYRCLAGHRWMDPDNIDEELLEVYR